MVKPKHRITAAVFCAVTLFALTHTAYSAPRFNPPPGEPQFIDEPQVSLAPIALSNSDLRPVPGERPNGGAQGFRPWFENGAWQGDLIELDISATGQVSSSVDPDAVPLDTTNNGNWSARVQFNNTAISNEDFWDDGTRKIIIGNGNGSASRFRWEELNSAQQQSIRSQAQIADGDAIVNFLRGDRSEEQSPDNPAGELRRRLSILGDIIHSPPKYVAAPNQGFNFNGYDSFVSSNQNRPARVYVGANDGMLHAFDAETGDEVFAYIPSMVTANLGRLSRLPYTHTYFVDGQIATGDVFFDGAWHTVLVGGLGAGGKGFYALDITDADVPSESALTNRLLWEIDDSNEDIGFSYSRPTITRLNDNRWYAIVGNGYNSESGKAKLLIIDIENGNVRDIETDNSGRNDNPNGLSSPALIDTDGDNRADIAYAGDIDGNLWKFDLTSNNPAQWRAAFNGQALLALGDDQPIIIPPDVVPNSATGGYFVYVGTGRAFAPEDLETRDVQSLYGVIDNLESPGSPNPVDQTLNESEFPLPRQFVRTATFNPVNVTGDPPNRAWRINLPAGERFLAELQTRAGRVQGLSFNPTTSEAENWLTQPAFDNGGAPTTTILDLNGDGDLTVEDHVDGDGDGNITSAQGDLPMGLLLGQGIRSRPTIVVVNTEVDTALINGLFVSALTDCPERFQDICLGQFTNLDEFGDRLDRLQREIERLNDRINRLQIELNRLIAEQRNLEQRLRTLEADANPDQQAISDTQRELDRVTREARNTRVDRNRARRNRNELRNQRDQAIEFRNSLQEDALLRQNGGERDINDVSISGIRSLGPNFALGRRSWVELEP